MTPGHANSEYANTCLPANDDRRTWSRLLGRPGQLGLDRSGASASTRRSPVPLPHRTFVIEWRTASHADHAKRLDFEILLHEGSPTISVVYGAMGETGDSATVGLQGEQAPAYDVTAGCNVTATIAPGEEIDFTPSAPTISGTPQAGQILTGMDATYVAGTTPLTSQTTWQLCDAAGAALLGGRARARRCRSPSRWSGTRSAWPQRRPIPKAPRRPSRRPPR